MASPAVEQDLHGRHRTTDDSGSRTSWKPTQGKLELLFLPFSRGGRVGAENIALNPKTMTFSSVLRGPAEPYLWELFPENVGPAGCNKFPDEILEGRSQSCRLTHLSGPMLVVRFPGPLHICRRLSHPVGGGAGAVVS